MTAMTDIGGRIVERGSMGVLGACSAGEETTAVLEEAFSPALIDSGEVLHDFGTFFGNDFFLRSEQIVVESGNVSR